jgi:hypothetical protein
LWHPDWTLDDVVVADSHRIRLLGLRSSGVTAVLLRTGSLHTFTMREPIRLTPLGSTGRVGHSAVVKPRRVVSFPRLSWILETSLNIDGPPAGIVVRVLPSGFDVRDIHTLRHTDREPI